MAARFLVSGGTGNWDSTTNWSATSGGASGASFPVAADTVAFDSLSGNAPMTVNVASACTSLIMSGTYAGTLTFNSTLTLTSTCTFVSACTIAGSAGTLILNTGGYTITSGGKTLTCALTLGTNATYTLADNWTVNGLVSCAQSTGTMTVTANQITCAGGFRHAGANNTILSGTTKLVLTGGTWDASGTGTINKTIDLAGNVTVSGTIVLGNVTLTYVSGTITTTGSVLTVNSTSTFNTVGVTWNSISLIGSSQTYTLSSNFAWSGTLTLGSSVTTTYTGAGTMSGTGAVALGTSSPTITLNNTGGLVTTGTMTHPNSNVTWAGSAGFTVGTLTTATLTATRTYTLTFGNTYTVTTAFSNVGTTLAIRQAIVSSTPGSKVVLTVSPGATVDLVYCDPTDVNSAGGEEIVAIRGTITTSTNWVSSATLPALANVRSGTVYGTGTGTLALPAAGDVRTGTGYGAAGTEFTGTLAASGGGSRVMGLGI